MSAQLRSSFKVQKQTGNSSWSGRLRSVSKQYKASSVSKQYKASSVSQQKKKEPSATPSVQPYSSYTSLYKITNTLEWKEQLYLDEYGTPEEQEHYNDDDDREIPSKPIGSCNF